MSHHVTIIGAGIVGATVALNLQREGHQVRLLDAAGAGEGCSYGNAGGICPDAIIPAATPGLLANVPKWLVDKDGPLSVDWKYLPRAIPWLLRWAREGRIERIRANSTALAALGAGAVEAYRDLLGTQAYADLIRCEGQLMVWRAETPVEGLARELRDKAGVPVERLMRDDLAQLEPALGKSIRSGLLFPRNGHTVNPERLVKSLVGSLVAEGGEFLRRRVTGFECDAEGPKRIYTDCGTYAVQSMVVAGGAASRELVSQLGGLYTPLQAERGYHVTFRHAASGLRRPVLDAERKVMYTQMEHGLRVAGTVEIAGLHTAPNYQRAFTLARQAQEMFDGLNVDEASHWMGGRPSMPDSIPVIDRHPVFHGVYMAFGHGHLGLSGAPRTGRLIADMLAGRKHSIDANPFRYSRFRNA